MLKKGVDFLLYVPNFTRTCFGIWLPSSGGRECLISYSSNVLCYGRVRIMTRPVWPVAVECVQVYKKTSTTSLSICWSFCKMLGSTIKMILTLFIHVTFWDLTFYSARE